MKPIVRGTLAGSGAFLRVLFLVWALLVACPAWAVEFVFVTPDPAVDAAEQNDLAALPQVNVRGGKALSFREVVVGENPRIDAVRSVFAASRAIGHLAHLWDQAIKAAPPPAQAWVATEKCLPVWVKPPGVSWFGPEFQGLVPVKIRRGGKDFFAPHLLTIADLRTESRAGISVEELIAAGMLIRMVCHEGFHGIQSELYRERGLLFSLLAQPTGSHDSPTETDSHLAFREGFAEAGELWMARLFPTEFSPSSAPSLRPPVRDFALKIFRHRQKLAERNRYIFTANGAVKDGALKPGEIAVATEGVIASLLFTLLAHGNWENPVAVLFAALSHGAPLTLFECVEQLIREQPRHAATIQRILLEYTRYTILSKVAAKQYEQYYLARKAFLVGRLQREDYHKARNAWEEWKQGQWARIQQGKPMFQAAPQPLMISSRGGYALDLNDEDEERLVWHLEAFIPGADATEIQRQAKLYGTRIIARRQDVGCFRSLAEIGDVLPKWLYGKLLAGFQRYSRQLEGSLDQELTRRRRLAW